MTGWMLIKMKHLHFSAIGIHGQFTGRIIEHVKRPPLSNMECLVSNVFHGVEILTCSIFPTEKFQNYFID